MGLFEWLESILTLGDKKHPARCVRVEPTRYSGWWVRYPIPSRPNRVPKPPAGLHPILAVGDRIRLRGKPAMVRTVLSVEWHLYRHDFVYIVQTSAPDGVRPYWFGDQLERIIN